MLGHRDVTSTRRYAKLADEALIYALRDREGGEDSSPACPPRESREENINGKQYVDGGGGGNRTRVRMASNQRVYVRSPRSNSGGAVARSWRNPHPISTWISSPDTAEKRSETSLLMTPATP